MSESDSRKKVVVRPDDSDIRIEKVFDLEVFRIPSVVYKIESLSDNKFNIRFEERIPNEIDSSDIGFHPQRGAEYWKKTSDKIIFSSTLSPGEEIITLFGVADQNTKWSDWNDTIDIKIETISKNQESESSVGDEIWVEQFTSNLETEDLLFSQGANTVTGALVVELSNDLVATESRNQLAKELLEESGSLQAQLSHLQSQISELSAYKNALKDFLDDQGTADIIEEFESDLRSLRDQVEENIESIKENNNQIKHNSDELRNISNMVENSNNKIQENSESIERLVNQTADIHKKQQNIQSNVDSIEGTISDLKTSIEDVNEFRSSLRQLERDLDQLSTFRSRLSESLSNVEAD